MSRSEEFTGSVREKLEAIAQSLRHAATSVEATSQSCDGTVDGLERVTRDLDTLVTSCAELMARATDAAELASECTRRDRRMALPQVAPSPADAIEMASIHDRLDETSPWNGENDIPCDIESLIARLEAEQRWLDERRWGIDDLGHALSSLLYIRSALRQIEAVIQAGEAFAQHDPTNILAALVLAAKRLRVRRTRER
jgi:hypothetical protein